MTNYVKTTNFAAKDALLSGNPQKIISGTAIDTEFNNISTAITSKADIASPNLTGTPTCPDQAGGTNSTAIANTKFVTAAVNAVYSGTNTFLGLHNFRDTSFRLQDNSDITKFANFELSGISTNTTRTYTLPNLNGTLALTSDIPVNDILTNTSVSGSYSVTTSAIIRITATHNFSVGQEVQLTFTNNSGSGLASGAYVITAISGTAWFEVNYGSNVTSAGSVTAERYGLVAYANAKDMEAGVTQLKAVSPKQFFDNKLVLMAEQTPNGLSSATFNNIPSWVKRVTVMFNGVSSTANASGTGYVIQLGTASTLRTSGYVGGVSYGSGAVTSATLSSGFIANFNFDATDACYTVAVFTNISGSTWLGNIIGHRVGGGAFSYCTGAVNLGAVLGQIVITTPSFFDASGTINVMYE